MESQIQDFWKCFILIQLDMLFACKNQNEKQIKILLNRLEKHPALKEKGLFLIVLFPTLENHKATLIFRTRGEKKRKQQAYSILEYAPILDNWVYRVSLQSFQKTDVPFSLYFQYIKQTVYENQVYVHLFKIYKSSNKLHLYIYMDLNRHGVPKEKINAFANEMLVFYLGEELFYKHISMIKIARRKLKRINYFPLRELKSLIQFKSPY